LAAAANVRRSSTTLGRICSETPGNDRDVRIVSDGLGDPRSMAAPAGAEGVRPSAPKIEELAMMCLGFRRLWPGHLLVSAVRSPVGHAAELSHAATARGSAYDSAVCSYYSAPRRYDSARRRYDSARRRYDSARRRYDSARRRYDSARAVLERRLRSEAQRRPVAAPLPRSATHGSKSEPFEGRKRSVIRTPFSTLASRRFAELRRVVRRHSRFFSVGHSSARESPCVLPPAETTLPAAVIPL
jgi:hypothetical protein